MATATKTTKTMMLTTMIKKTASNKSNNKLVGRGNSDVDMKPH